jgi:hypothetical protein
MSSCSGSGLSLGERVKRDFDVLGREVNGHSLVYLDTAATSQKPNEMLDVSWCGLPPEAGVLLFWEFSLCFLSGFLTSEGAWASTALSLLCLCNQTGVLLVH